MRRLFRRCSVLLLFLLLWNVEPGAWLHHALSRAWAAQRNLSPLAARGRELVTDLNCAACHQIEDQTPQPGAPPLDFEGERVRPEWLFDFLKQPRSIRPWLRMRMPTFRLGDREALAITKFLETQRKRHDEPLPAKFRFAGRSEPELTDAAKKLMTPEYLDCLTCHLRGKESRSVKPDERAPDLSLVPQRLNPDWIIRWLQDPQSFQPGVKMPNFFDDESSGPEDILGGDEARQMIALRDFLVTQSSDPLPAEYQRAVRQNPDVTPEMGRQLMAQFNCVGCHGDIPGLPPRREIAPSLAQQGRKAQVTWLIEFLTESREIRREAYNLGTGGRMPNFRFTPDEAEAVAEYLRTLR
ncbi:MAG: c-type cytochrome [Candidatus Tectomicrobia bacterium]|nr:c-type cytochrome [Candidatus Tectomicrobia bacterium]